MKRYIYIRSNSYGPDKYAVADQIKALVDPTLPDGLELYIDVDDDLNGAYISIRNGQMKYSNIDLSRYHLQSKNKDIAGAAKYVSQYLLDCIDQGTLVAKTNYDAFLHQYDSYFDIIADIVSSVARKYDSDMTYDPYATTDQIKGYIVDSLIQYQKVCWIERSITLSKALGFKVTGKSPYGYRLVFTNGVIEVEGPTGIYYNGNSADVSLKHFKEDCARLEIALEDYFDELQDGIDNAEPGKRNISYKSHRYDDSYPEREEERRAAAAEAAAHKPQRKKKKWSSVISQLRSDLESYDDPLYEQTDSGDYILQLCGDVHEKLKLFVEPSIQGGRGGVWIYDDDTNELLADGYDFETFNDNIIDIALNSANMADFKKKYQAYLESDVL